MAYHKKKVNRQQLNSLVSGEPVSQGVLGTVIVSNSGAPLRTTLDVSLLKTCEHCLRAPAFWFLKFVRIAAFQESLTRQYAEMIPGLADLARNMVRDLDPQNDLEFLRIRSFKHEIMVAASKSLGKEVLCCASACAWGFILSCDDAPAAACHAMRDDIDMGTGCFVGDARTNLGNHGTCIVHLVSTDLS